MVPNDFFTTTLIDHGDGFPPYEQDVLDRPRLERLRAQPLAELGDLSVAIALTQLVHQEFEAFGTDGSTASPIPTRNSCFALSGVASGGSGSTSVCRGAT